MRKLYNHSKSTLFLMEMILSILILSLTCTACVQIFAAARNNREKARQYNHIQELTVCAEEVLEGWDGRNETFTDLLPAVPRQKIPSSTSMIGTGNCAEKQMSAIP